MHGERREGRNGQGKVGDVMYVSLGSDELSVGVIQVECYMCF